MNLSHSALKRLRNELRQIKKNGIEGARVKLTDENNIAEWEVGIFGPPGTLYEGGFYKLWMRFPSDYPSAPPTLQFQHRMWHPNIYANGRVCMSILDPHSSPIWCSVAYSPDLSVTTIILSLISLLDDPNLSSLADLEAGSMYEKWLESNGRYEIYENKIRRLAENTRRSAEKANVRVPTRVEEYTAAPKRGACPNETHSGHFWRHVKRFLRRLMKKTRKLISC